MPRHEVFLEISIISVRCDHHRLQEVLVNAIIGRPQTIESQAALETIDAFGALTALAYCYYG
jgi:hypothetical protein